MTDVPENVGKLQIVIRDWSECDVDVTPAPNPEPYDEQEAQTLGGNLQDLENEYEDWKNPKPRHTHETEQAPASYPAPRELTIVIRLVRSDGTRWCPPATPLESVDENIENREETRIIARFVFKYTTLGK